MGIKFDDNDEYDEFCKQSGSCIKSISVLGLEAGVRGVMECSRQGAFVCKTYYQTAEPGTGSTISTGFRKLNKAKGVVLIYHEHVKDSSRAAS